jgi:FkbH-like protein
MRELKYTEILKANNQLKKQVENNKPYQIMVLSNITCNQLGATLSYHLMQQGVNPVIGFGNYDNIVQDSFNLLDQQLVIVHYELLNVVGKTDCYVEDLSDEQIEEIASSLEGELGMVLQNLSTIPCVLFDRFNANAISISPMRRNRFAELARRLNQFVEENKSSNTYLIDINAIFNKIGGDNALDFKLYNLSKTLYTISYWKEYVYLVSPVLLKVTGKVKKAVIFDCDNTLWKGILGEDGIDGIDMSEHSKIGGIYHQVQNMAVWLSKHGVLIGLCSKNNPEDVADVIERHPEMALKNENIVISQVNWDDKASNLRAIAETLNIGLDSLVFVDDSDFEINLIKEQLPQVLCMQVPEAIYDYPAKLGEIINTYFYFSDSKADLDKTNQYKQQAERAKQKSKFTDITEYLRSLEMEVTFGVDKAEEAERVSQLTQKTNQLNVCTTRYTQAQIEAIKESPNQSYISLSVKDKFGDSGLTGVAIVSYTAGKGEINDFLMSCRVMGRNIEFAFVDYMMSFLKDHGCKTVDSQYIPTQKNKPVSDFFDKCGFPVISENEGNKSYALNMDDYKENSIDYIKVN